MAVEFDRYASDYDRLLRDPVRDRFGGGSRFFHERKWALIQEHFAKRNLATEGLRWLDAGCGRGELLALGASRFGEACGCDLAAEMAKNSRIQTVHQLSPSELPFGDARFDFVTAVCVFHHVAPAGRPGLASEMARVLAPGGTACIIEHNPWNPVTRLIVSRTPVDANAILVSAAECRRLLEGAGLTPAEPQYFLYLPRVLYQFAGKLESLFAKLPFGGQYACFSRKLP